MYVHNIKGTSNRNPNTNSPTWKEFWETKAWEPFYKCSCSDCNNKAEVGAHVQRDGHEGANYWYVVPLCDECAKKTSSFEVRTSDLIRVTNKD